MRPVKIVSFLVVAGAARRIIVLDMQQQIQKPNVLHDLLRPSKATPIKKSATRTVS
jgi:hypothetical protein